MLTAEEGDRPVGGADPPELENPFWNRKVGTAISGRSRNGKRLEQSALLSGPRTSARRTTLRDKGAVEGEEGCRELAYAPGKRRLTAPFPLQLWAQPGLRTPRARGWSRVVSRTRHRPLPSCPGAPDAAHPAHSPPAGGAVPTLDGRGQSEAAVSEGTRRPLLPPERGSGSDARDRWGQSWCRWGGEKLSLPPLPGAAEVKAEAGLAGAGTPWGARDMGSLPKPSRVETSFHSPEGPHPSSVSMGMGIQPPFSVSMETRTLPLFAQLVAPRLPRGFSV